MNQELQTKYNQLIKYLASLGSAAVAFSSGVDSTFLLYAAKEALGEHVLAITAASDLFPKRELNEARTFCEKISVRQLIIYPDELAIEGFASNPKNRCYLCKYDLFSKIKEVAKEQGMAAVIEGSNLDDMGDYRPGMQAIAELMVKSPLRETGFSKQEIRTLLKEFGIDVWEKPSFACLASRIPYGDEITKEKLARVEQAEQLLLDMGFHQVRVRIHGGVARIELEQAEFARFMQEEIRTEVYRKFQEYGFDYVALDLLGYRTGSMNETIL